jgi:S1-C subfamily serine protease
VNIVDFLVVAGVGAAVVSGVRAGLVGIAAGAIGTIVGLMLGSAIATDVTRSLELRGGGEVFAVSVVVVIAVALVSFVVQVAAAPLAASIRGMHLGWVDRTAGGVIGFVGSIALAWLLGGVLATGPSQSFAREVQDSVLLREIDDRLPAAPGVVAELQQALLNHGMPLPFVGFEPRLDPVAPPSTEALAAAQAAAAASTVRVSGAGCGGGLTGSGVVVASGLVVTNAHVVAGIDAISVDAGDGRHDALPVWFDPDTDLAVLRVDGMTVPPLALATQDAATGQGAAVLGYPAGGPLVVAPAAVLDRREAVGRDIYGHGTVTREVYILQSSVRPGDSGGPFVDQTGTVLGIVFARSNVDDDVGYALTSDEVRSVLALVPANSAEVDTRSCAN